MLMERTEFTKPDGRRLWRYGSSGRRLERIDAARKPATSSERLEAKVRMCRAWGGFRTGPPA